MVVARNNSTAAIKFAPQAPVDHSLFQEDEFHAERRGAAAAVEFTVALRRSALTVLRKVRKVRCKYLPEELFCDPCWEMLLDLYESYLSGEEVTVTGLGVTSGVPLSTALRRMQELQRHGLIERVEDRNDKRRLLVNLTSAGLQAIDNFFDGYLGPVAVVRPVQSSDMAGQSVGLQSQAAITSPRTPGNRHHEPDGPSSCPEAKRKR